MNELFQASDVIHTHTRAQLIEDGDLIDVSETAREAGFTVPVAITRAAWADCVEWTAETDKRKATIQDEAGRLWDVIYMARLAARVRGDQPRRVFELYRVPVQGRGIRPRRVALAMHIGPGDAGEPVITIGLPKEDEARGVPDEGTRYPTRPGAHNMARFIPENAETREFPAAAVVAYCYESKRGPALLAYKGRQSKPARFLAFGSAEARDRSLASFVEYEEGIETRKRERQQAGHGLAVGDIVYSVWGYEQTNVTFYEVVRVPSGRSATVRELEADRIESAPGSMTGKSTPKPGQYVQGAKEKTRRATGWHTLGELSKWDGTPRPVTWYA